jgi:ABC-type Mn2+/Zn2+ transport system permease subunit
MMKVKSALQHSKSHAKFLGVVLGVLLCLLAVVPNIAIGIFVGLSALGLLMESINIVYITRKARHNPDYLEEKIK